MELEGCLQICWQLEGYPQAFLGRKHLEIDFGAVCQPTEPAITPLGPKKFSPLALAGNISSVSDSL